MAASHRRPRDFPCLRHTPLMVDFFLHMPQGEEVWGPTRAVLPIITTTTAFSHSNKDR